MNQNIFFVHNPTSNLFHDNNNELVSQIWNQQKNQSFKNYQTNNIQQTPKKVHKNNDQIQNNSLIKTQKAKYQNYTFKRKPIFVKDHQKDINKSSITYNQINKNNRKRTKIFSQESKSLIQTNSKSNQSKIKNKLSVTQSKNYQRNNQTIKKSLFDIQKGKHKKQQLNQSQRITLYLNNQNKTKIVSSSQPNDSTKKMSQNHSQLEKVINFNSNNNNKINKVSEGTPIEIVPNFYKIRVSNQRLIQTNINNSTHSKIVQNNNNNLAFSNPNLTVHQRVINYNSHNFKKILQETPEKNTHNTKKYITYSSDIIQNNQPNKVIYKSTQSKSSISSKKYSSSIQPKPLQSSQLPHIVDGNGLLYDQDAIKKRNHIFEQQNVNNLTNRNGFTFINTNIQNLQIQRNSQNQQNKILINSRNDLKTSNYTQTILQMKKIISNLQIKFARLEKIQKESESQKQQQQRLEQNQQKTQNKDNLSKKIVKYKQKMEQSKNLIQDYIKRNQNLRQNSEQLTKAINVLTLQI